MFLKMPHIDGRPILRGRNLPWKCMIGRLAGGERSNHQPAVRIAPRALLRAHELAQGLGKDPASKHRVWVRVVSRKAGSKQQIDAVAKSIAPIIYRAAVSWLKMQTHWRPLLTQTEET